MSHEIYGNGFPFAVERWMPDLGKDSVIDREDLSWGHCYVVSANKRLDPDLVQRSILIAKEETGWANAIDDLDDVGGAIRLGIDVDVVKLTHALGHISVSEIARTSRSAYIWLLNKMLVGGIAERVIAFSTMGYSLVAFSFREGFAESPEDEIRGVVRACDRVLGV